jgi:hypothetical protein
MSGLRRIVEYRTLTRQMARGRLRVVVTLRVTGLPHAERGGYFPPLASSGGTFTIRRYTTLDERTTP